MIGLTAADVVGKHMTELLEKNGGPVRDPGGA